MEAADNEVTTNIVKGKRTKRQRVQSPICFALTPNSSSIDADGGNINDAIAGDCDSGSGRDDYTNGKISTNISLATSFQEFHYQDSTEEEEDVANCLILLAQCHSKDHSPKQDTEHDHISAATARVYNATNISNTTGGGNSNKFNSRRFLETGSSGSGKAGYYVYECKTCCRTFPSFQALGGHRASHKKPKGIHNNDEKKQLTVSSDEEDGHYKDISSLSLQLSNNNNNNNNNNNRGARVYINHHQSKAKIHECSICGAEFTSGQALGGHMRRHRAPVGAAATASTTTSNTNLSLTPMAVESEEPKKARNLISLDLDLNLPAPDDERQAFASKQQQQQQKQDQQQKSPLVFSGPTLVDCHY